MNDVKVTIHREPPNATPAAMEFGYVQGELGDTRIHIPVLLRLLDDPSEVEAFKNRVRALTRWEAEQHQPSCDIRDCDQPRDIGSGLCSVHRARAMEQSTRDVDR